MEAENTVSDNDKNRERRRRQFVIRESPLTELIKESPHIRAIYHIFAVILIMLLLNTVIYDLVESGKINIGLSIVVGGFGGIKRGAVLWLFQFGCALSVYPGLQIYNLGIKCFKKSTVLLRAWKLMGLTGLILLQVALFAVPVRNLFTKKLDLATSATITLEMKVAPYELQELSGKNIVFNMYTWYILVVLYIIPTLLRFMMKIHAVSVTCIPRCHHHGPPLPTFRHYVYFLFAPTLLYRDHYPRTNRIRWTVVIYHFLEVLAIMFYHSFLWERFILPNWSNYGKEPTVEAGTVVRGMFACVLPGMISFLCGFYCVLHAWLNAFAEIMRFGDRLFYEPWWTTSQFSNYYRAWNLVVYSWLRDHIYLPLIPILGRPISTVAVFLVSAVAHEVAIALSFGFFYPILLVEFVGFGLLMMPLTATSGRRYPNAFNFIMWLCLFLGNGLLWSLYSMEYFARKNCPPTPSDSFFVPKSWSCPNIILKPNWSFQNPLDIIYI